MKVKGITLVLLGVLGVIFVCTFDIIAGKPVNDITGLKSTLALIVCGIFIILGINFVLKSSRKKIK